MICCSKMFNQGTILALPHTCNYRTGKFLGFVLSPPTLSENVEIGSIGVAKMGVLDQFTYASRKKQSTAEQHLNQHRLVS